MKTSNLDLVFLFLLMASSVLSYNIFNEVVLPTSVIGPESVAFDLGGGGPYVTVADGRILKWQGSNVGFVDFAYTSPNRLCYLNFIYTPFKP